MKHWSSLLGACFCIALLAACGNGNVPSSSVQASIGALQPPTSNRVLAVFNYTGGPQKFVVPSGMTQLTIITRGASGGGASGSGGLGGALKATVPVRPGERLRISSVAKARTAARAGTTAAVSLGQGKPAEAGAPRMCGRVASNSKTVCSSPAAEAARAGRSTPTRVGKAAAGEAQLVAPVTAEVQVVVMPAAAGRVVRKLRGEAAVERGSALLATTTREILTAVATGPVATTECWVLAATAPFRSVTSPAAAVAADTTAGAAGALAPTVGFMHTPATARIRLPPPAAVGAADHHTRKKAPSAS